MVGPIASARLAAPAHVVDRRVATLPQPEARRPVADVVRIDTAAGERVGSGSIARAAATFDGGLQGDSLRAAQVAQRKDGAGALEDLQRARAMVQNFRGGTGNVARRAAGISTTVGMGFDAARAFAAYAAVSRGGAPDPSVNGRP